MNLQESIRRILKEEDFIPLESLNIVIEDYEDGFDVFIMNKDKKIGEISFTKESLPNQYTIVDATIDDEYKGNRIYPKTIINLFKERPNLIINSVFRSPDAEKSWRYLLSKLPSNIVKSVKYYKDEDTTLYQLKLKNIQECIRRIIMEEKDHTKLIKSIIDSSNIYDYKYFCGVDITNPEERSDQYLYLNKDKIPYLIKVYFVGGPNSEVWPKTQAIHDKELDLMEEVRQYIKSLAPFNIQMVRVYVNSCDGYERIMKQKYTTDNLKENIRRILREELLRESENITNKILDKIGEYGFDSLTKAEKKYLDNKSKDIYDDELENIVSIDTGYEFKDVVDGFDVIFIYNETEEWDDDPVEYKHTGEFFIDGEEYYATMYTDENYNVHSFDLHDGIDYVEFDDELEESLLEFFQQVGDKIKQNII